MVSDYDITGLYFIRLGAMGTLIAIVMLIAFRLLIVWQENKKNQIRNDRASNAGQSVELDRIQRRIKEKQEQQKVQRQRREKKLEAERLSKEQAQAEEQERIRQAQLLAQENLHENFVLI